MVEVVRTTSATFGSIDDEVAAAASAGSVTLDEWRDLRRSFYDACRDEMAALLGEPGWRLTDDEPMVVTWFRLVG